MAPRPRLTIKERWQAVTLCEEGVARREMVRRINVNLSTIVRLWRKYQQTGEVDDKPGRGRRRKTTEREDRHAIRTVLANRKTTAVDLAGQMQRELGVTMTPRS